MTSGTRKLARATLDLIATFASTKFLTRREEFLFAAECVTGARIGELVGAQVGHGAFANHYALLRWSGEHTNAAGKKTRWEPPPGVAEGDSFCEHENETSKTSVPIIMCVVSKTKGDAAIDLGKALQNYWAACDFDIKTTREGGWIVQRPDFSVVQIALQAFRGDGRKTAALRRWLLKPVNGFCRDS